jgi:hypothetical protein
MAAFSQFDQEPLAETVMRRGQEKNFHGNAPAIRKLIAKIADLHPKDDKATA